MAWRRYNLDDEKDLKDAENELRGLGTNMFRNPETQDERFILLYVELEEHYHHKGKDFAKFCRENLAVAQHNAVLRMIGAQPAMA